MALFKKIGGIFLIILGFLALITPLTPGAWLMFVGLELIGVRLAAWDKMKAWLESRRAMYFKPRQDRETEKEHSIT